MILEFDSRLVEQTIGRALEASPSAEWRKAREDTYQIADREDRDRAFTDLAGRWFARLGLDVPVRETLLEFPTIGRSVARGVVVPTARPKDEGAELYVRPDDLGGESSRQLVIRLRVETLLDKDNLVALLRRELCFVEDMVDPKFGYEPELPACPAGPTEDRLLMGRYGAAWAVTVQGRLVRRGWLPPAARAHALADFQGAFPMLAREEQPFRRLFERERPTHAELVRFVQSPRTGGGTSEVREPGSRCPLCGMPSYSFVDVGEVGVRELVLRDFPTWVPSHGACPQCESLYQARLTSAGWAKGEHG